MYFICWKVYWFRQERWLQVFHRFAPSWYRYDRQMSSGWELTCVFSLNKFGDSGLSVPCQIFCYKDFITVVFQFLFSTENFIFCFPCFELIDNLEFVISVWSTYWVRPVNIIRCYCDFHFFTDADYSGFRICVSLISSRFGDIVKSQGCATAVLFQVVQVVFKIINSLL